MKIYQLTLSVFIVFICFSCGKKSDEMPPAATMQLAVTLNPAGVNPLCAKLDVATNVAGKVKIEVVGQDGEASNISHTFSEIATSQSVPILGLYPDYENVVHVSLFDGNNNELIQKELKITTEGLPEYHPNITIIAVSPQKMEPGLTFISSRSNPPPNRPYMIDAFGKVRWVLDFNNHPILGNLYYDVGMERLQNGNFYFGDSTTDAIYEIDVYGEIINTWNFPGYDFHHNVQEKPNGDFLITATKSGSYHQNGFPTVEDYILEIDRQTSAILTEWDLKESLDESRTALDVMLDEDPVDWAHANAVIYDESDNTIIVSCQRQGVAKLDDENNVVWILSPHRGWGMNRRGENLNDFLLNPLDANGLPITNAAVIDGSATHIDFEWNWLQHAPMIMPNGHLMLFDNGQYRHFGSGPDYSRAVEYAIDEAAMTVRQIWQYGKERGEETYSYIVSDVDFLPTKNNILFSPGFCNHPDPNIRGGRIVEVDYNTKEVIFEVFLNMGQIDFQFHRAERLGIYP